MFAFSRAWMTPKKGCLQDCARSYLWTTKRMQLLRLTWPCCCQFVSLAAPVDCWRTTPCWSQAWGPKPHSPYHRIWSHAWGQWRRAWFFARQEIAKQIFARAKAWASERQRATCWGFEGCDKLGRFPGWFLWNCDWPRVHFCASSQENDDRPPVNPEKLRMRCFCAGATTYCPSLEFAPHEFLHDGIGFEASKGTWSIDLNTIKLHHARWEMLCTKWDVLFCTSPLECRQTIPTVLSPNFLFSVGNLWISLRCFLHNSGTLEKSLRVAARVSWIHMIIVAPSFNPESNTRRGSSPCSQANGPIEPAPCRFSAGSNLRWG